MERTIKRFNLDFKELIERVGLPKTTKMASHVCTTGGVTTSANVETEVHPRLTDLLSVVASTAHTIEDPFSYSIYTPIQETHSYSKTYSFTRTDATGAVVCSVSPSCIPAGWFSQVSHIIYPAEPTANPDIESVSVTFPYSVDDSTANPYINNYLYHDHPIARYVNTWANPHWLYWPWFPIDLADDAAPILS